MAGLWCSKTKTTHAVVVSTLFQLLHLTLYRLCYPYFYYLLTPPFHWRRGGRLFALVQNVVRITTACVPPSLRPDISGVWSFTNRRHHMEDNEDQCAERHLDFRR